MAEVGASSRLDLEHLPGHEVNLSPEAAEQSALGEQWLRVSEQRDEEGHEEEDQVQEQVDQEEATCLYELVVDEFLDLIL